MQQYCFYGHLMSLSFDRCSCLEQGASLSEGCMAKFLVARAKMGHKYLVREVLCK